MVRVFERFGLNSRSAIKTSNFKFWICHFQMTMGEIYSLHSCINLSKPHLPSGEKGDLDLNVLKVWHLSYYAENS